MADLSNAYALVIGVAGYRTIRPLPYTDDAQDVAAVLRDPEVCGYTEVTQLVEAEATRAAILAELDRLAGIPPDSTVLIYFSGHGARVEQGAHGGDYLLPVDAAFPPDDALAASAIPSRVFTEKLNAIGARAARLTVILDCCHAGGIGETKDLMVRVAPGLSDAYVATLGAGQGRVILAATRASDPAYVLSGARHGAFTGFLLEGLRGGARGQRGVIRVVDLFDYVEENLAKSRPPQQPVLKAELEKNFPIALHLGGKSGSGETVKGGLEVLIRLAKDPAQRAVILGIQGNLKAARARIRGVVVLKGLHDALHDIQFKRYNQIAQERERLRTDPGAAQNLRVHANRVITGAKQIRAPVAEAYPETGGWVDDLARAAELMAQGAAKAGNPDLIDEGLWGLNEVLSTIPSQINTDLKENIRAMSLRELFRALLRVQDEMERLQADPAEVRALAAGGRDLGRLDRDIDDLMTQHDRWQAIDDRMRRI
ncbi:MAG TPA: caspase family protein, partial [Isosphaeraceae bacterium]